MAEAPVSSVPSAAAFYPWRGHSHAAPPPPEEDGAVSSSDLEAMYDLAENVEDERVRGGMGGVSRILLDRLMMRGVRVNPPSENLSSYEYLDPHDIADHSAPSPTNPYYTPNSPTGDSSSSSAAVFLSGDSLAFTIVYLSVFCATLVYVAVQLMRKHRLRRRNNAAAATTSPHNSPTTAAALDVSDAVSTATLSSLPPPPSCNHRQCNLAHEVMLATRLVPYAGFGSVLFPEILAAGNSSEHHHHHHQRQRHMQVQQQHSTANCDDSCTNCRQLAMPPPSYSKLFLDENPPSYSDAVVMAEAAEVEEKQPRAGQCQTAETDRPVAETVQQVAETERLVAETERLVAETDRETAAATNTSTSGRCTAGSSTPPPEYLP